MIRDVVRSVRRGLGPSRLKAGFDLSALSKLVDNRDDVPFDMDRPAHMTDLMILCSWFMLRELEISFARDTHLTISGNEVQIMVPVHKTSTHGSLTVRSLRCACGVRDQPLCPWHAAERHLIRLGDHPHKSNQGYFPLFPSSEGDAITKYLFTKALRQTLQQAGVETTINDTGGKPIERYGGHSLRVAGAQFMAAAGVQTALIQLLGRWSSSAIERYIQTAPLSVVPQIPTEILSSEVGRNTKTGLGNPGTPAVVPPTPTVAPYPAPATPAREALVHSRLISDPLEGQDMSLGASMRASADTAQIAEHSAQIQSIKQEIFALARAVKPPDELMIARPRSSVIHRSLCDELQNPPNQWRTRCGWKYGLSRFFRVGIMSDTQRCCRKCFDLAAAREEGGPDESEEDSSSSSSSSSSTPSS